MRDINTDRSIRDIPITHHRHSSRMPDMPRPRRRRRMGRLWLVAIGVITLSALAGLLLSTIFAGASVAVVPKRAVITLPASVTALHQGDAPAAALSYQIFTVTEGATTSAPATGTEQVQKQASGAIAIRNTGAQQRLIANTRFEAPDGKIYRIHDSVVVPAGSATKPGTVSATAYADSPGADYNRSGTTSYTVPGFKGDPRYTAITASSGAMAGGFVGSQPAVSAAELAKAKQSLAQQLDAAVRGDVTGQIPEGYEVIDGTLRITYGDVSQAPAGSGSASVTQGATAQGALVRINDLAATAAKSGIAGYNGEPITFADPGAVSVSAATSSALGGALTLSLSGSSDVVWVFDSAALKNALIGKPKSQFESVIASFAPAIEQADATIRPFWSSTFPSDPNKISISVKTAQ